MYEKDKYLKLKINFMNCTVDSELHYVMEKRFTLILFKLETLKRVRVMFIVSDILSSILLQTHHHCL